ncbi:MAG: glycosyltransferase family 2 protein [Nitrospinae bacterium]|nr:glycosyltransferase family 2 protein [Nitrospinota bacterium]
MISVVIPVYNEVESLTPLMERLLPAMAAIGEPYEVIFIDDGSSDGTARALDNIGEKQRGLVKVIHFRTNMGKSAALQAGFDESAGELIVMMDGDLQDQPEEINKLLAALREKNLDMVTGWKANRMDPISKTFPSKFFNRMLNRLSGLSIHDFNCGLKAFKRECLTSFTLYGQLHRFILVLAAHRGFKVGEVPVIHAPRLYGVSKYGVKRFYHGIMDILTVFFITRYLESPLYFFGIYGVTSMLVAVPIGAYFLIMHFLSFGWADPRWRLTEHPIWIVSPILFLLGLIMIFFGLIGELITYHLISSGRSGPHQVKRPPAD